jgi:hypothetical protein
MFDASTGTFAANKVMRELGESGGIGRTVTHTPGFIIPTEEDFVPDVTVLDMGFKWFSAEVPAKEELMSREVVFSKDGDTYDGIYLDWNVLIEVDKSFAISNGVFTIMVAGELENALGTVPKVGMYYCKPVYTYLDKNLIGCKFSFRWETIHPINPKYLPDSVVDINLADYGIDINPALASGGGKFTVENVGTFWEDVTTAKMLTFVSTNLGGAYDVHTPGGYSLAYYNGTILHQVAMSITLMNSNNILDVHLCIVRYNTVGANIYCTVSATAAPA